MNDGAYNKLPTQIFIEPYKSFAGMDNVYSSMKGDFDAKRPLELHAIYENAIALAKQYGATMPLTEMLLQQLQFLNERNILRL